MRIEVKLFGPQAQAAGIRVAALDLPDAPVTCTAIRRALVEKYPQLTDGLAGSRFAVNHEFAADSTAIHHGDEVALIGQVSGG